MYKLYLLGALALSNVEAYVSLPYAFGPPASITGLPTSFQQYTYAVTADCFSAGTASMLGLNNMYHEYFQFTMSKGTVTWAAFVYTTTPAATTNGQSATYAYKGCYHAHLYNWMAQPQVSSVTSTAGLGNTGVAYGYQMTGTAVTACTMTTVTTTSIYKTNVFYGAQFQSVSSILNGADPNAITGSIAQTTIIAYLANWVQTYGTNYLYTPIVVAQAFVKGTGITLPAIIGIAGTLGVDIKSASTAYWDFMQTNVFTGQTQFGRGGGSTSPCGWWVVYANEAPGAGQINSAPATTPAGSPITTFNIQADASDLLVNMWTDNALTNTLCAFVMASLAAILY